MVERGSSGFPVTIYDMWSCVCGPWVTVQSRTCLSDYCMLLVVSDCHMRPVEIKLDPLQLVSKGFRPGYKVTLA